MFSRDANLCLFLFYLVNVTEKKHEKSFKKQIMWVVSKWEKVLYLHSHHNFSFFSFRVCLQFFHFTFGTPKIRTNKSNIRQNIFFFFIEIYVKIDGKAKTKEKKKKKPSTDMFGIYDCIFLIFIQFDSHWMRHIQHWIAPVRIVWSRYVVENQQVTSPLLLKAVKYLPKHHIIDVVPAQR